MIISALRSIGLCLVLACSMAFAEPVVLENHTHAVSANGVLIENIGIETLGGVFTPLLKRGCQTPCSSTQVFSTADDSQTEIKLFIFRGIAKVTKKAKKVAAVEVVGIPPAPRGTPQIAVTFSVENGQILLSAIDKGTNSPREINRRGF